MLLWECSNFYSSKMYKKEAFCFAAAFTLKHSKQRDRKKQQHWRKIYVQRNIYGKYIDVIYESVDEFSVSELLNINCCEKCQRVCLCPDKQRKEKSLLMCRLVSSMTLIRWGHWSKHVHPQRPGFISAKKRLENYFIKSFSFISRHVNLQHLITEPDPRGFLWGNSLYK